MQAVVVNESSVARKLRSASLEHVISSARISVGSKANIGKVAAFN
jgi:hypothetical protein